MPNLESHLDTVGGARYITVCDVQNAYHQIPIAASEQEKTASAMVHLPSSWGDKENTFRYFVHKSNTCSHSPGENVVV